MGRGVITITSVRDRRWGPHSPLAKTRRLPASVSNGCDVVASLPKAGDTETRGDRNVSGRNMPPANHPVSGFPLSSSVSFPPPNTNMLGQHAVLPLPDASLANGPTDQPVNYVAP